jgi:hypothetical protein
MNAKQVTLTLAILGTLGDLLLALKEVLTPTQAALVGAIGAGCYAFMRTFQKKLAGDEWKTWLRTTEAWGVLLAIVAPVMLAAAGVVPKEYAAPVLAVAGLMLKAARMLQTTLPGGPKSDITTLPPPPAVLLLLSLGTLLWAGQVRAQTPQLGTCLDTANRWCVQPATAVGWQINLATGDLRNGAVLLGYALVHQAGFAFGAGLYGGMGLASEGPNSPQGHVLLSLTNFGAAGCGVQRPKFASGATAWQWVCGLYGALQFGGSPGYK